MAVDVFTTTILHEVKQCPLQRLPLPLRQLLLLFIPCLLSGCGGTGGSEQVVVFERGYEPGLTFAMPYGGQNNVPTGSRVTLKFTDPILDTNLNDAIQVTRAVDGKNVAGIISESDVDPTILYFTPNDPLYEGEQYDVSINELNTPEGTIEGQKSLYSFTTRSAFNSEFTLLRQMPSGHFPFMDFSTINLTFSKAVLDVSVKVGESLFFQEADTGVDIPVGIYVQGTNITIDPVDDLNPEKEYTLRLTEQVSSVSGDSFAGFSKTFAPQNSHPRGGLNMRMTSTPHDVDDPNYPKSPLTSAPMNTVRFASQLLGGQNIIPLTGTMNCEIAHLPNHPDVSPMILRKGLVFTGEGFDILVGGNIPVALHSGDIKMTLLSDAQGFMVKSVFSDYRYASNNVHIFMDVALEASNPKVQAMITQDVLHAELIGTIVSKDGKMIFDASGIVENDILKIGVATNEISFHLESIEDGEPVERQPALQQPLEIVSTYPSLNDAPLSPDNDIAIYFSNVIEETTFTPGKNLKLVMVSPDDNSEAFVPFDMSIQGAALHIRPTTPLPYGAEYRIDIDTSVTDKARNPLSAPAALSFHTETFSKQAPKPAIVKNVYPGFPCAMTDKKL